MMTDRLHEHLGRAEAERDAALAKVSELEAERADLVYAGIAKDEALSAALARADADAETCKTREDEIRSLSRHLEAALARAERAERSLRASGFTDHGGELWKPPIGKRPDFETIDALRADLARAERERDNAIDETHRWKRAERESTLHMQDAQRERDRLRAAIDAMLCNSFSMANEPGEVNTHVREQWYVVTAAEFNRLRTALAGEEGE